MVRDTRDYLEDIVRYARLAKAFVGDMTFERFETDIKTQLAVVRALEVLGEAAKRIPDETRAVVPSLEWRRMSSMRDFLEHQYRDVDLRVMYNTVVQDLDVVVDSLAKIIEDKA